MIELSVIIPVFNEAACIQANTLAVKEKLMSLNVSFEIILVNDGSKDGTLAKIQAISKGPIKVISDDKNHGKGYAVMQGMRAATGKFQLFMDADLSTSLNAIQEFLSLMRKGQYDVILGDRHPLNQKISQPFYRIFLGRMFLWLSCLCVGKKINDFTCGFKMFTLDASRVIFNKQRLHNWAFDTEIIYIAIVQHMRIGQVPVIWHHEAHSKVNAFRDVFTSLWGLIRIKFTKYK